MLTGINASPGIGIGRAFLVKRQSLAYKPYTPENTEAELRLYRQAVADFCNLTEDKARELAETAGEKEAEILRAHILMMQDPYMNGEIEKLITEGQCAPAALESVCNLFINVFSSAEDELTNQRAADVRDVRTGVLSRLLHVEEPDLSQLPDGTVLVADELTPSMTAGIHKGQIAAIITEQGGRTSHSAILARALEIPAVLNIEAITAQVNEGDAVIVDGTEGHVLLHPELEQITAYTVKRDAFLKQQAALSRFAGKPTVTADGTRLELFANIGNPQDAQKAMDCDAEGVGLFRTEFLYMDAAALPSEEQQFEAYQKAALLLKGKPLILRTLDIGGDKEIPYLHLEKEENPFLGLRGIRFCLQRKDLFRQQLRAILRAAAFGDIRIMLPMVTSLEEIKAVRSLLAELQEELAQAGITAPQTIPLGVMIETPAAVLLADLLAQEADFFSIGTNDLTQYMLCVDRGNSKAAYLYSHYHPAVLRAIRHVIRAGTNARIPVGMCGEAAADPLMAPLLIAYGLNEFSVSPASVLASRKSIAAWSQKEALQVAADAERLPTAGAVADFLKTQQK